MVKADELGVEGRKALERQGLGKEGLFEAPEGQLCSPVMWTRPASGSLLQVCTSFTAEYARYGHVQMHHGYTNVLGLGDSSTWRLPCLNRYVYMFLAPLLIPIITPLVAVGE